MSPEAFVCPHCRTWVEGEGRSIRCPSCGKRFPANEARLDRQHASVHDTLDYEVPPQDQIENGGWRPGWDVPEDEMGPSANTRKPEHNAADPGPDESHFDGAEQGRWSTPEPTTVDYEDFGHSQTDRSNGETTESRPEGAIPWRWILSGAFLVLVFAGSRFLSGELFIVAFIALIAAQWLLGREDRD